MKLIFPLVAVMILSLSAFADYVDDHKVTRYEWGSKGPKRKEGLNNFAGLPTKIIFNHTASIIRDLRSKTEEAKLMRSIEFCHNSKFDDIGYHAVVAPSGTIYEARSMDYKGAHTLGNRGNHVSIGLAFMGCYDEVECSKEKKPVTKVTPELIEGAAQYIAHLARKFDISVDEVYPRSVYESEGTKFPGSPGNKIIEKWDEMIARATELLSSDNE